MPPALSESSITGGPSVGLERRATTPPRSRVEPSRRAKAIAGALEVRLDQIEQRGPLREDERLVAVGDRVLERLEQRARPSTRSPARAARARAPGDTRPGAAAAAPRAPPARCRRSASCSTTSRRGSPRGPRRRARARSSSSSTVEHRVGARRQLGRDVALRGGAARTAGSARAGARRRPASPSAIGAA